MQLCLPNPEKSWREIPHDMSECDSESTATNPKIFIGNGIDQWQMGSLDGQPFHFFILLMG